MQSLDLCRVCSDVVLCIIHCVQKVTSAGNVADLGEKGCPVLHRICASTTHVNASNGQAHEPFGTGCASAWHAGTPLLSSTSSHCAQKPLKIAPLNVEDRYVCMEGWNSAHVPRHALKGSTRKMKREVNI